MQTTFSLPNARLWSIPDLSMLPLETINVEGNHLHALDGLPLTLKSLNVRRNSLIQDGLFLPFPNLETLLADENHIGIYDEDDFVFCFPSLKTLSLSRNVLRTTGFLRESTIEELSIDHNRITILSGLPQTLTSLKADHNQITMVQSKLPPGLVSIDLGYNPLRYAGLSFNWPSGLRELHLNNTEIERFPRNLPDSLETLSLNANRLTSVPAKLPSSLKILSLCSNKLRFVPQVLTSKRLKVLLLDDNCLTIAPSEVLAQIVSAEKNWFDTTYHDAQKVLKRSLKRYVLTLRLRQYTRMNLVREELYSVSMMPERWDQIDILDPIWFRRS